MALTFGILHADLSGRDLTNNPYLFAVFNGLFAVVIIAFVLKRVQVYQIKKRKPQAAPKSKSATP